MKHLILGFMFLFLTSVATAQTETDWRTLRTMSGTKVSAVKGAKKIDISTARTLHERGVPFIDESGIKAHIPGSVVLTYPYKAALMKIVDKNKEVVFYCACDTGSATCNLSPNASARAVAWGYKKVYYFTNFDAWRAAGYPIKKAK